MSSIEVVRHQLLSRDIPVDLQDHMTGIEQATHLDFNFRQIITQGTAELEIEGTSKKRTTHLRFFTDPESSEKNRIQKLTVVHKKSGDRTDTVFSLFGVMDELSIQLETVSNYSKVRKATVNLQHDWQGYQTGEIRIDRGPYVRIAHIEEEGWKLLSNSSSQEHSPEQVQEALDICIEATTALIEQSGFFSTEKV